MTTTYEIHPRMGVARLGNASEFYLAPEAIGGLPIACDSNGNTSQPATPVSVFKDAVGRIKRQAAKFYVYQNIDGQKQRLSLGQGIQHIRWTVHIANKKPIWYTFSELQGDLEFGESNSYANNHITVNNPDVLGDARKKLMIDPGPRHIEAPGSQVEITRYNIPEAYSTGAFPPVDAGGTAINTLGELRMDAQGNLVALGGFGNVTGMGDITSFRGAAGYWDDIADGYVLATLTLDDGTQIDAEPAWLLVGSPKYAPELVNITTLADTMQDVAIRQMGAAPQQYSNTAYPSGNFPLHNGYTPLKGFNPEYCVNYARDIKPIIDRMLAYRWVADIPYLATFASPQFDLTDNADSNQKNRQEFFDFFRVPVLPQDYAQWIDKVPNGPNQLFASNGLPLMPLNSGDNSVTNTGPIYKFETLSPTQYFYLYQWAQGHFNTDTLPAADEATALDEASVGNCVGAPFSPGIETTWIVRNAPIYNAPGHLKLAHFDSGNKALVHYYEQYGLSTVKDEAEGEGCEPGDLTKRMAIPWQSDFQECTVQTPNITHGGINQFADGTGIEVPPAYYVYWWPPQSPMHVVAGSLDPADQVLDGIVSNIDGQPIIPAGQRVPYQRGINSIQDMITSWSRLGFIVNQGGEAYPYFTEKERNSQALGQFVALAQGAKTNAAANK